MKNAKTEADKKGVESKISLKTCRKGFSQRKGLFSIKGMKKRKRMREIALIWIVLKLIKS
ncbi:hypothetical protein [Helicobacter pylori]|uniref:hypothetical protein n=1 Tax=Helicobacter pylori TaxID=210 RepID=UPI003CC86329